MAALDAALAELREKREVTQQSREALRKARWGEATALHKIWYEEAGTPALWSGERQGCCRMISVTPRSDSVQG
jgi:hypothetical protein